MAKDVITVNGEDRVVREDTAKSYRAVIWALASVIGFAIITAIVFFVFFGGTLSGDDVQSPATIEQKREQGR